MRRGWAARRAGVGAGGLEDAFRVWGNGVELGAGVAGHRWEKLAELPRCSRSLYLEQGRLCLSSYNRDDRLARPRTSGVLDAVQRRHSRDGQGGTAHTHGMLPLILVMTRGCHCSRSTTALSTQDALCSDGPHSTRPRHLAGSRAACRGCQYLRKVTLARLL